MTDYLLSSKAKKIRDEIRDFVRWVPRAVDDKVDPGRIRMLVSETKKFVTEACQKVVYNSMQVMGGIGYTNIFPIERIHRDLRLSSIWTGTSEVMAMVIANEWYRQYGQMKTAGLSRDYEKDAGEADAADEKIFE